MANQISAEADALRKGRVAVEDAQRGINSEIRRVRGDIEQMRSYWSGDAASAFTQMVNAWDQKTTSINNQLNDLARQLGETEREQERNEQEHEQNVSKIASMLG